MNCTNCNPAEYDFEIPVVIYWKRVLKLFGKSSGKYLCSSMISVSLDFTLGFDFTLGIFITPTFSLPDSLSISKCLTMKCYLSTFYIFDCKKNSSIRYFQGLLLRFSSIYSNPLDTGYKLKVMWRSEDVLDISWMFCVSSIYTAQKMKFSIKDFFSKCDQICSFLQIWSDLLKKSLLENFIFCAVLVLNPRENSSALNGYF